MPKIPDFSELTKKIDLQGIVDSLKSAIGSTPAKPLEGDEVAVKFAELAGMAQKLATMHSEQAALISDLYTKINALAKQVQASHATPSEPESKSD